MNVRLKELAGDLRLISDELFEQATPPVIDIQSGGMTLTDAMNVITREIPDDYVTLTLQLARFQTRGEIEVAWNVYDGKNQRAFHGKTLESALKQFADAIEADKQKPQTIDDAQAVIDGTIQPKDGEPPF
jgi:hypothetical protein